MNELVFIPQEHIAQTWPLAEQFITDACKYGEYEPSQLYQDCLEGKAQLWLVWSGKVEAAVVTFALKDRCYIAACGGRDMGNWLHLLKEIEAWAKENGCQAMRLYGRKGWLKKLPDYRITRYVMDKTL